jgi:drug/metabolite transporter (DMT)-like permease
MGAATALLVLGSALIHAIWNAVLKRTRAPEAAVVGVLFVSALSAVAIALATRAPMPPVLSVAWCAASGVLEAFYFATLARALARGPLGPVYTTIRGGALVVVWPISILCFHEHVSRATAIGTLLVVVGLVVTGAAETPRRAAPASAGAGPEAAATPATPASATNETPPATSAAASAASAASAAASAASGARSLTRGLGWAIVCAAFVGGYQIAYKVALETGGHANAVVALSLGSASLANVATLGRRRARAAWGAVRAEPARVVSAGVMTTVGFAIFLVAMGRAGAGAVVTLRNTSVLFAQLVAFAMGERPKRLGVAGAVLVTGGAILLAR